MPTTSPPTTPTAATKPVDPYAAPPVPPRVGLADTTAVQGLLAVEHLDGWLLFDRDGENPIAERRKSPRMVIRSGRGST